MANQTIARQEAEITQSQTWESAQEETPTVSNRRLMIIMVSVLLGILLAALDQTIVGPALPKIIGDLKGFDHYAWVVTIYLLTSTIPVPIIGKMTDTYGRKWFFLAGIAVFILGSALSGLSWNIYSLIGFRGVQGLGAGILFASAFAIIADLIPPRDRGKWQGVFGAVWGLAAVIGPTIGGQLTDNLSWHWVFYVNVPIGLVALAVLFFTFPNETRHTTNKVIDVWGALALTASLGPLLLALSLGRDWGWTSALTIGMFAASALFMAAFLFIEARANDAAIIPLDLFKSRIFVVSAIVVFVTGMGLFGAVLYIPLFIQAIQGDSATSSGNALTPMMLSLVAASIISGQVISRTGRYWIMGVIGMGLVTLGAFLLYTMTMTTDRLTTIEYMVLLGLGMGITFPLYTLVVQNAFTIARVGVVTATVQFFRSVGSTVGVAVLGSLVNNQFHEAFPQEFANKLNALKETLPGPIAATLKPEQFLQGLSNLDPQALVSPQGAAQLQAQLISHGVPAQFAPSIMGVITDAMRPALFSGIQQAFLIGAILLGVGFVATIFLPEIALRKTNQVPQPAMAEGGAVAAHGQPTGTGVALPEAHTNGWQHDL
ncbi:MAG: MDR family MFS transporter [Chloroflexia bacterium]